MDLFSREFEMSLILKCFSFLFLLPVDLFKWSCTPTQTDKNNKVPYKGQACFGFEALARTAQMPSDHTLVPMSCQEIMFVDIK